MGVNANWFLLQDRLTGNTTLTRCLENLSLSQCTEQFNQKTKFDSKNPEKGSRGVLLIGGSSPINRFSPDENIKYNSTAWNFKTQLYELVGEFFSQ
jgi:hypothetical protein